MLPIIKITEKIAAIIGRAVVNTRLSWLFSFPISKSTKGNPLKTSCKLLGYKAANARKMSRPVEIPATINAAFYKCVVL